MKKIRNYRKYLVGASGLCFRTPEKDFIKYLSLEIPPEKLLGGYYPINYEDIYEESIQEFKLEVEKE